MTDHIDGSSPQLRDDLLKLHQLVMAVTAASFCVIALIGLAWHPATRLARA